jgi:hypothetical protein
MILSGISGARAASVRDFADRAFPSKGRMAPERTPSVDEVLASAFGYGNLNTIERWDAVARMQAGVGEARLQ